MATIILSYDQLNDAYKRFNAEYERCKKELEDALFGKTYTTCFGFAKKTNIFSDLKDYVGMRELGPKHGDPLYYEYEMWAWRASDLAILKTHRDAAFKATDKRITVEVDRNKFEFDKYKDFVMDENGKTID